MRGEGDCRDVAAPGERVGGLDRPGKITVEILRIVRAEPPRRVDQHGLRVDQTLIERRGVNEGLQRRTGRPPAARPIDLAGNGFVEKIRGTHLRENFHGARIDQHGGGVLHPEPAVGFDIGRDAFLDKPLQIAIERRGDFALGSLLAHHAQHEMRCEEFAFPIGADVEFSALKFVVV